MNESKETEFSFIRGSEAAKKLSPEWMNAFDKVMPEWLSLLVPAYKVCKKRGVSFFRVSNVIDEWSKPEKFEEDGYSYLLWNKPGEILRMSFDAKGDGEQISAYSNITALDFDHINSDNDLHNTQTMLKNIPYVAAIFCTFKPWRIKALVMHDNTDSTKHKEMYEQLIDLFGAFGIDGSCKDLSRNTYLPWDEGIWVNPGCTPYHFVTPQETIRPKTLSKTIIVYKN
ncbi:MAG: hypothetical protein K2G15_04455 [Muribaculaceae bacterium]|nr:hypothetical protein [Muribaculaceae bacterium]